MSFSEDDAKGFTLFHPSTYDKVSQEEKITNEAIFQAPESLITINWIGIIAAIWVAVLCEYIYHNTEYALCY